jgi:hypothetical protein
MRDRLWHNEITARDDVASVDVDSMTSGRFGAVQAPER